MSFDKEKLKGEFFDSIKNSDLGKAEEALDKQKDILDIVLNSDVLKKYIDDIKMFFNMLRDYFNGKCDLPIQTIIAIGVTLIYVLSPVDFIPDFIPVVGFIDDAFVIGLCIELITGDIENYKKNCIGLVK